MTVAFSSKDREDELIDSTLRVLKLRGLWLTLCVMKSLMLLAID